MCRDEIILRVRVVFNIGSVNSDEVPAVDLTMTEATPCPQMAMIVGSGVLLISPDHNA